MQKLNVYTEDGGYYIPCTTKTFVDSNLWYSIQISWLSLIIFFQFYKRKYFPAVGKIWKFDGSKDIKITSCLYPWSPNNYFIPSGVYILSDLNTGVYILPDFQTGVYNPPDVNAGVYILKDFQTGVYDLLDSNAGLYILPDFNAGV